MAAALLWLAKRARLPELPSGLVILALLWLYVQVTGASPSSVRAWIMAAFLWGGRASDRDTPPLQSLALACAVTLILSPEACADAGFQLSYAAVLGIIAAGGPAANLCAQPTEAERLTPVAAQTATQKLRWRARKLLLGGLCVSLAATLAGTPLTLGLFGSASWGGVFVNLVLVPLSEIPLMLGMASVACSVSDWLAWPAMWLNGLAAALLHIMTWIAQTCALVPSINLELPLPHRWLGPLGGALLALAFLTQAQSKSLARLLGVPAVALAGWLLLVFFLHALS
jgi:competence protein ComEC